MGLVRQVNIIKNNGSKWINKPKKVIHIYSLIWDNSNEKYPPHDGWSICSGCLEEK